MKIEIFTVCEYAQTMGNIINVSKPFDTIVAEKTPVMRSLYIALRLRYKCENLEEKTIEFKILNPKRENLLTDKIEARVEITPSEMNTMCINLALNLENMPFKEIGEYTVAIETDGETHEVPLYVVAKK